VSSSSTIQRKRAARIWPRVLLFLVVVVGGLIFVGVRWFSAEFARTRVIAEAQIPSVMGIAETWELDALFDAAAPELKKQTPATVARAYLDEWRNQLGACTSLELAGHHFQSRTGGKTIVTGHYAGRFEHGSARIVATFKPENGEWRILSINVTDIVSSASSRPAATP
jgi:hypothetical protein